MNRWLGIVALICAVVGPVRAFAHTKSETHSAWQIAGASVHLTFTIPDIEAKRLSSADSRPPSNDAIIQYLSPLLSASSDGHGCALSAPPRAITAAAGYRRFEFTYDCPSERSIQLHSAAFFDLVPTHVNFAQIQTADGRFVEQLITQDHQTLDVSDNAVSPLQNAGFMQYVMLGILHIFTGVDHQSFLLGLILISRRVRDLAFVITGFTVGHSVTLALAVTGILRPHAEYIDALIGLTIALVGAENIALTSRRPGLVALFTGGLLLIMAAGRLAGFGGLPALLTLGAGIFGANYLLISGHLRDAARMRIIVTSVFGLVHGFGFASDLLEMRLPVGRLAELLVGFNLGVEVGQLTVVVVVLAAVALLVRMRLAFPRALVVDGASSALIGLGLFWLVSRSYA